MTTGNCWRCGCAVVTDGKLPEKMSSDWGPGDALGARYECLGCNHAVAFEQLDYCLQRVSLRGQAHWALELAREEWKSPRAREAARWVNRVASRAGHPHTLFESVGARDVEALFAWVRA